MLDCVRPSLPLSPAAVYREANLDIRPFVDQMIEESLIEPSEIRGFEHLEKLVALARNGSACLLLMEHFSNFDLPVLSYLLRKNGVAGEAVAKALIAVAGMKLDTDCPVVAAFAEAYRRIIISPSRASAEATATTHPHFARNRVINLAAAKKIRTKKKLGNLVLIFPSGTRHRPGDPSTRQGRRETDSYIKSFDYMCLISINGNILRVQDKGGMAEDFICRDQVAICASDVLECRSFRETVRKQTPPGTDKKQAVADEAMQRLALMHAEVNASSGELQPRSLIAESWRGHGPRPTIPSQLKLKL